ncbi:MAG: nucleotidyltransferase [Nitriliruptoraceae bacterium]|nr:nucleotidyltransferase [Nitriliruptoraceae bacterium]
MSTEDLLASWTGPSSTSEQEKQERTERMIRDAVRAHPAFDGVSLRTFAKGSYPNNTNVRVDSDVDVAVECNEVVYWEESTPGAGRAATSGSRYEGPWTPTKLRTEVAGALRARFGDQVDASGTTAIRVRSSSARVEADVVPCFAYEYHLPGETRRGTRIFRKNGDAIENYPDQHLERGRTKNTGTTSRFKKTVRILKRVENAMVEQQVHRAVPSFLVESLVYNCPNTLLRRTTWTGTVGAVLAHIWESHQGDAEPAEPDRWLEVNECKYLHFAAQPWSRRDAREFAFAAWNYLELG